MWPNTTATHAHTGQLHDIHWTWIRQHKQTCEIVYCCTTWVSVASEWLPLVASNRSQHHILPNNKEKRQSLTLIYLLLTLIHLKPIFIRSIHYHSIPLTLTDHSPLIWVKVIQLASRLVPIPHWTGTWGIASRQVIWVCKGGVVRVPSRSRTTDGGQ